VRDAGQQNYFYIIQFYQDKIFEITPQTLGRGEVGELVPPPLELMIPSTITARKSTN